MQARVGVSTLSARQEYLTFCHLCCGHCAVKVTVADNVIVDMAPDFESGLSNEQCVYKKGRLSIPEIHSHPDRLLYPLKRVGARGEGKWERISWDEALDTIADKFRTDQRGIRAGVRDLRPGRAARTGVRLRPAVRLGVRHART